METISQMATTAAKYAFGESTSQEPISGSQGDVSKGEPYDAGNLDPSEQERIGQSLGGSTESGSDAVASKRENTGRITTATNATDDAGFTHPQHDMSAPGLSGSGSGGGGVTTATNRTTDSSFTTPGQDMGGSAGSLSSNNQQSASSNQDLNRTGTENVDSKSKPSEKPSSAQDDNNDDVNVSGPGPRDISAVARENGGDAGRHGAETSPSSSSPDTKQKQAGDLPADESQDKGTGELYVKSSGLQADGGNFDATKPGAGREADRLMEQKGITSTSTNAKDKSKEQHHKSGSGGSEGKEKHGLVEKIKEKLHKH